MTPMSILPLFPGPVSAVSGVKHKQSDAQPSSQHQACILSTYTLATVAGYHDMIELTRELCYVELTRSYMS